MPDGSAAASRGPALRERRYGAQQARYSTRHELARRRRPRSRYRSRAGSRRLSSSHSLAVSPPRGITQQGNGNGAARARERNPGE